MFGQPKPEGAGKGLPAQPISVFDKETNLTTTYDSIAEAARALNIKKGVIDMFLVRNQVKPYKGRYIFKKL